MGYCHTSKRKEPYETMIYLMLAESGDDSIYSMLKQKYYTKEVNTFDTVLYELLAEESARRQDYDALKLQSQRIITQLIKIPEKENYKAPELINILSKFLSHLIKHKALESLKLVEGIDVNNLYCRGSLIAACKIAQNSNCESVLKKMEPVYDSLKATIKTNQQASYEWQRWIEALKATNTQWSRNEIIADADYIGNQVFWILADLGNKRALTLTINNVDGKKTNSLYWLDALKLGEVQVAAGNSQFQWAKQYGEVLQYFKYYQVS